MLPDPYSSYIELFMLFLGLVIGVPAGMTIETYLSEKHRQAWREKNRSRWSGNRRQKDHSNVVPWSKSRASAPIFSDSAEQLRIVMRAEFAIQPILNKPEARVFKELDRMVIECNPDWQVMAQVSIGEILRTKDAKAYSCVNSKRVDLLLMDDKCMPRHAIEYQGAGHHQGDAAARDAVKKEALRRAGIGYHEIVAGVTTPAELRALVTKLVGPG